MGIREDIPLFPFHPEKRHFDFGTSGLFLSPIPKSRVPSPSLLGKPNSRRAVGFLFETGEGLFNQSIAIFSIYTARHIKKGSCVSTRAFKPIKF
jgi:hypothetical protein